MEPKGYLDAGNIFRQFHLFSEIFENLVNIGITSNASIKTECYLALWVHRIRKPGRGCAPVELECVYYTYKFAC